MSDRTRKRIGRAGFAARGVLYVIVGVVALSVAFQDGGRPADQVGALAALADGGGTRVLLSAMAIGLGLYAAFRVIEVLTGVSGEDGASESFERVVSLVRAVIYGALCFYACTFLLDSRAEASGGSNESRSTSDVFALPGGRAIVIGGGLVMIGVAGYQAYRAWTGDFREELATERMRPAMRRISEWSGKYGHAARALIYLLIGGFLLKAGIEHEADDAIGLDGALRKLADQPFGPVLLIVTALGLLVFGLYSLIEARHRRL